jgi:hypothetical protein
MVDILIDVLTYVVVILLIIGVITLYLRHHLRRDRAWPVAAESLGMQYTRFDDTPLDVFAGFKTFDALGRRSLANVVTGTQSNARVWLADYRYGNDITRKTESCGFTVCLLQRERLKMPHFRLQSRSTPRWRMIQTPILSRPGEDDPEVPLDGEFARMFMLQTRMADDVRPFLGPGFRERITAIWWPHIEIESLGDRLVVTRRQHIEPADLRQLLDQAISILDELSKVKWA